MNDEYSKVIYEETGNPGAPLWVLARNFLETDNVIKALGAQDISGSMNIIRDCQGSKRRIKTTIPTSAEVAQITQVYLVQGRSSEEDVKIVATYNRRAPANREGQDSYKFTAKGIERCVEEFNQCFRDYPAANR